MKKTPILNIPLFESIYAYPTATNHPTGDAFFKNQIATVSPQYDADVKTGRALALSLTNDLPIEVKDGGYVTVYDLDRGEHVTYDDTGTEVVT